jgi:hypothetical protein
MLQAMRKTIPKSELMNGGLGEDIYTSMFDEELAKSVAGNSPNSLADLLYKSLEPHLETVEAGVTGDGNQTPTIPTSIENTERLQISPFNRSDFELQKLNNDKESPEKTATPVGDIPENKPKIVTDPILQEFGETIDKASRQFDVDPRLIYSVIKAESGGHPDALSSKGARGLMQLVDSTAADMGVTDSLDPHQNIMGGTRYLRQLLDRYDGSVKLALAAYNAGPATVSKYNGVPPYRETRQYIENILAQLHSAKKP